MSEEVTQELSRLNTNGQRDEAWTPIGNRPFGLWIGLLAPLKNPLDVVDIARMVPEMDFVMVGWSYDKSIAERIETERPANVYYLGTVSDDLKRELIEKCCVGLTTSKYEGFGLTPFEFLRAGRPVLAYPLEVFKEVYGDLIIYVNDIDDFVRHLKQLCSNPSSATVDVNAVVRRQARYDLAKAASRVAQRLDARSLLVFTEDVSIGQDTIAGYYLLQWRLWKFIRENGIDLHVFANGRRFSMEFGLADQTTQVGRVVGHLRRRMETLKESPKCLDGVERRAADMAIRVLEPLCYVCRYIARSKDISSRAIIATGYSQIFGSMIVKYLFGLKVACLVHDARLYRYAWVRSSLLMKIYYLTYTHALKHVDLIMVVSNTMRKEFLKFLNFYSHADRLIVIWNE